MASPMPTRDSIRVLLTDLCAREVKVDKSPTPIKDLPFLADLIDDEGELVAVCGLDLPLSAYAAASLCGVPAGAAKDSIKAGKLEQSQRETLREVVNILSAVFNGENMPHLRLKELYATGEGDHAKLLALVKKPPGRYDLDVNITGYGAGKMMLAVVR